MGFLTVKSNSELLEEEQAALEQDWEARQKEPVILGLASYLRGCWEAAHRAKQPIETLMLRAARQRNGEYETGKLCEIRKVFGTEIYMRLTDTKCTAAEDWLEDILLDTGTPPWDLQPTPIPELSPEQMEETEQLTAEKVLAMVEETGRAPSPEETEEIREIAMQEYRYTLLQKASNRAKRMKLRISDQFAEGGWAGSIRAFITDLATYPNAFLKGPVTRRQRKLEYTQDENGMTTVDVGETLAPEWDWVDPYHMYPEPGISRIEEGYMFEYHPLTRMDLSDLIGVPGYDEDAIRSLLDMGNSSSWIPEARHLEENIEERKYNAWSRPTDIFDALEFWGRISGKMLLEWGMDPEEITDPAREYDANVWLCGNYVLKAVLNYDPLGRSPYFTTSYRKRPGAFWGKSIPEILSDVQDVCNATARALINNMALSSGPQIEVDNDRLSEQEDITDIFPMKIWQVNKDISGSSTPAIRFTQPENIAPSLLQVYERFLKYADDQTGIPSYIHGDLNVHGAGRTSSGLSMLMGAAGKGIRKVVMNIDSDIIKPAIFRQFVYNMRYEEDESIKGDVHIVARGATNLAVRETANMRRIEFLNATANPIDLEIIGKQGRAAVLREVVKGLQMPVDIIVPSVEREGFDAKVEARMQAQAPPQEAEPSFPGRASEDGGMPMGGRGANTVSPRGPEETGQ